MTVVRMPLAEVTGLAVARLFDVVQGRPTRGDVFIRTSAGARAALVDRPTLRT